MLIKAWSRKVPKRFCEPCSYWRSLLIASENTTDARKRLTCPEHPDPAAGFMQSQGCAHVQPIARSGSEFTIHPRNTSIAGWMYQMKPCIFQRCNVLEGMEEAGEHPCWEEDGEMLVQSEFHCWIGGLLKVRSFSAQPLAVIVCCYMGLVPVVSLVRGWKSPLGSVAVILLCI